jgi:hypothetical protein
MATMMIAPPAANIARAVAASRSLRKLTGPDRKP